MIAPEIFNPEYSVFSSQRTSIEFETIRLLNEIENIKVNKAQLDKMTSLDYKTYNTQEEHLDVVKATIYFNLSNNIQEIHRFKPITLLPISAILGEMLGVFIVFFLHYWKNN